MVGKTLVQWLENFILKATEIRLFLLSEDEEDAVVHYTLWHSDMYEKQW